MRTIDETDNVYERLTVIEPYNPEKHGGFARCTTGALWFVRCECGNTAIVYGANLRNGKTRSCGCLRREKAGQWKKVRR